MDMDVAMFYLSTIGTSFAVLSVVTFIFEKIMDDLFP